MGDDERTENKEMDLVLSSEEAKPRLKWTAALHRRFVDAVAQLGGCEKATPKSLVRSMSIPGLTLYHLKSHLQKYRLIGKNQRLESCSHNGAEEVDYRELEITSDHVNGDSSGRPRTEIDKSLHIAQTLQAQLEVQKKLDDQIEVQKHLQLRIEAQGKYLQSILAKAQDKLYSHGTSTAARTTQVTESIDTRNHSSSVTSELTEIRGFSLMSSAQRKTRGGGTYSADSSLASSESSGKEIEKVQIDLSADEEEEIHNEYSKDTPLLLLMETESSSSSGVVGKKRSNSGITSDVQPITKKPNTISIPAGELRKHIGVKELDLNCEYQDEVDSEF